MTGVGGLARLFAPAVLVAGAGRGLGWFTGCSSRLAGRRWCGCDGQRRWRTRWGCWPGTRWTGCSATPPVAPGGRLRAGRGRAGAPPLPPGPSGGYGVHHPGRRRAGIARRGRRGGHPAPAGDPGGARGGRHVERAGRPHAAPRGDSHGSDAARRRPARCPETARSPLWAGPVDAGRVGAGPCHSRVGRGEHLRRGCRSAALGCGRRPARAAGLPRGQHPRRDGRAPVGALRAVRHPGRSAGRRAQPRAVPADRTAHHRRRAGRARGPPACLAGVAAGPQRPPEPQRRSVRGGDGRCARGPPRWAQRLLRALRGPAVPRRRSPSRGAAPEAGRPDLRRGRAGRSRAGRRVSGDPRPTGRCREQAGTGRGAAGSGR